MRAGFVAVLCLTSLLAARDAGAQPQIEFACPPGGHPFVAHAPLLNFDVAAPRRPQRLIVGLPPAGSADEEQGRIRALLDRLEPVGVRLVHHYVGLNAVLLKAARDEDLVPIANRLAECPGAVRYIELDYNAPLEQTNTAPNDPFLSVQGSFKKMRIPEAWAFGTGSREVVAAVIDSGIDLEHADLKENLWTSPCAPSNAPPPSSCPGQVVGVSGDVHGWNFDTPTAPPDDSVGHGTQVAGVIGAVGGNGLCVAGVNHRIGLVALKVADSNSASLDAVVRALQYATAIPADVVNASWSIHPSQLLYDAVAAAGAKQVVVVAAAPGRTPDVDQGGTPDYPCGIGLDNVICVTATDGNDSLWPGASVGAVSVDLGATATEVRTTFKDNDNCFGAPPSSSIATPHVTGVAALLRAKCPDLPAAAVRQRILDSVACEQCLEGLTVSGGRLDATAALEPACPPTAAVDPPGCEQRPGRPTLLP